MSNHKKAKAQIINHKKISRRDFLKLNTIWATGLIIYNLESNKVWAAQSAPGKFILTSSRKLGSLERAEGPELLEAASWYVAKSVHDGLEFTFPKGTLAKAHYLTSDMLLDGKDLAVFFLTLQEGEQGQAFILRYGLLNQCSARLRMPLSLVDMNRWRIDREGAWLKPQCDGQRVRLENVDRMTLTVERKSERPVRWCMTPIVATTEEVPTISTPILPKGKLIDELGQSTIHTWPGKSRSIDEVVERIKSQLKDAPNRKWPDSFSRWGGWKNKQFEPTGFFTKHFDGKRWWLVDPDGYAFWSAGIDCVRVDTAADFRGLETVLAWKPDPEGPYADIYGSRGSTINYLAANFIRAFGPDSWQEKWAQIALAQLRKVGFNTVGNWSQWQIASQARFPYVRPLRFRPKRVKTAYRDFPDVFDPEFAKDAEDYAQALKDTVDNPAMIGYFMMNEPTWAFSSELPAVGMLFNTPSCQTRRTLSDFLKKRHKNSAALASAWKVQTTFEKVANGRWDLPLNGKAKADLEEFSVMMVEQLFKTLRDACKTIAPNHMNLGIRYAGTPPRWAVKGMQSFDVFSMNCYREKIPAEDIQRIYNMLKMPVVIGEWHFGALDVGLPASGIGRVETQADRGKAYRVYLEDAAANPYCIGTHWFTLYDQSALGRFDGENYNIGFFDVCSRPHEPLCKAARNSHEALYEIVAGIRAPFDDAPQYLPKLFL